MSNWTSWTFLFVFRFFFVLDQNTVSMQTGIITQYSDEDFRQLLKEVVREVIVNSPQKDHVREQKPLTFKEGCKHVKLSESHVYKLTSTNQIPHSKQGKRIFFDALELDQWLLSNRVKTTKELDQEAAELLKSKKLKR